MHSTSTHFALARAKQALKAAELPFEVRLERASSTRNEVFLSPNYVIRVNRQPNQRLLRERKIYDFLPAATWTPTAVHAGGEYGSDYLIVDRKQGETLSRAWPTMRRSSRRRAVSSLAEVLEQVHAIDTPVSIPGLEVETHLLDPRAISPVLPALQAIDQLQSNPNVDSGVLEAVREIMLTGAEALTDYHQRTLIHGDLSFENVLWNGHEITGLLDFEWCRGSSPDLDLDVLLRFCAFPFAHVPEAYEQNTRPEDFSEVPIWFFEQTPDLFSHRHLHERLLAYCAAFDLRDLSENPPEGQSQLGPLHPMRRLQNLANNGAHVTPFLERLGLAD